MEINLKNYIDSVSNGTINYVDGMVGEEDSDLLLRVILEFKDPNRDSIGRRLIKSIFNKVKQTNERLQKILETNRYNLETRFSNGLFIIDYKIGEIKIKTSIDYE